MDFARGRWDQERRNVVYSWGLTGDAAKAKGWGMGVCLAGSGSSSGDTGRG